MIRFPEYLNLAPYMTGSDDKSPVYRLYAVVVHNDVMNAAFSGHYVCYVKNALGKWFKADDSVVSSIYHCIIFLGISCYFSLADMDVFVNSNFLGHAFRNYLFQP